MGDRPPHFTRRTLLRLNTTMSLESDNNELRRSTSAENAEMSQAVERYNASLAAWRAGKFTNHEERDTAISEFFSEDLVYDVKSADGSKVYRYGFCDVKDFFEWAGEFDYAFTQSTVVPGGAPN